MTPDRKKPKSEENDPMFIDEDGEPKVADPLHGRMFGGRAEPVGQSAEPGGKLLDHDELLTKTLEDSFPASDPPSYGGSSRLGPPERVEDGDAQDQASVGSKEKK